MKCVLMNKNTEVLIAEYDVIIKGFNKIYEIENINFAPLIIKNLYDKNKDVIPLLETLKI